MKKFCGVLLLILLLLIPSYLFAQNAAASDYGENADGMVYYVAKDGDDESTGLSTLTPWKSIERVNSSIFQPGDKILFKSGDEWRESLTIKNSGTKEKPIFYGSYGEGNRPRILGSKELSQWYHVTDNIWVSAESVEDPSYGENHNGQTKGKNHRWPGGAWFVKQDNTIIWGSQEKYIEHGFNELTKPYDWGWSDDHVFIFCEGDPHEVYQGLEVSQRQYTVGMLNHNAASFVVVDGLEMMFAQSKGFYSGYPAMEAHGLTINNCHVGYIGIKEAPSAKGLAFFHSDLLVQNNVIHDTGRHGATYAMYVPEGLTFENVVFEGNHFYNGYHTTGIDIQNGKNNLLRNFVFRHNHFEGNRDVDLNGEDYCNTNQVYIANGKNGVFTDFYFYNNLFTHGTGKGLSLNGVENSHVYNNTFLYGVNTTPANWQAQLYYSGKIKNSRVRNNIFYNDVDPNHNQYYFSVKADKNHIKEIDMDHNLFFTAETAANMVAIVGYTQYNQSEWRNYKGATGWDANSIFPTDPLFLNEDQGDYELSYSSPAIGIGETIIGITGEAPPLGAFDYSVIPCEKEFFSPSVE